MKSNVMIVGIASHMATMAAVARLEAAGNTVEVVAPEEAPKELYPNRKGIEISINEMHVLPDCYTSGQESRRERRRLKRKK